METVPNYLIGVGAVVLTVVLSVAGLLLVRRLVPLAVLQANHEVASAKFQVMGTLYAVLLAFVVVIVWQQFDAASATVDLEAAKLSDLFRDAAEYPEAERVRFRRQLRTYAEAVVSDEWEAMGHDTDSPKAQQEYNKLWDVYREIRPHDLTELAVTIETLRRMNELGENRNLRLLRSRASIHPVLWFALIAVGALSVSFGYFFGTHKLGPQILMTAIFSGTIALIVVVIIVLSHPFKGYGRISPEPFTRALARFRSLGD